MRAALASTLKVGPAHRCLFPFPSVCRCLSLRSGCLPTLLTRLILPRTVCAWLSPLLAGSAPVAITQLDAGGAAESAGLVVGDVIVRLMGNPVHMLTQKEIVGQFKARGMDPIELVVKNVCWAVDGDALV